MDEPIKNYIPGSMSFSEGFMGPRGNVGYEMSVDEEKAKKIIEKQIEDGRKITSAELGLDGDWRENSTTVYDEEGFHEYDAWGDSIWATPMLIIFYEDGPSEAYECWTKEENKD